MTTGCIHRLPRGVAILLAGSLVAALLWATAGHAAASADATALRACYKSIRTCQKSRCGKLDGQEQVTCMQQCTREYETCVGGAKGGGGFAFPQKEGTPSTERRRNMRRTKTPGGQN